jgi:transmembrane sensor
MHLEERDIKRMIDNYLKGNASPKEVELIERFFEENRTSALAEELDEKRYVFLEKKLQNNIERRINGDGQGNQWTWRVAAAVAAIIVVGAAFFLLPSQKNEQIAEVPPATLVRTTSKGQKITIKLPDGSIVKLNSKSTLEFPERFTGKTREVILHGEGYFDVMHNPDLPFVVRTGSSSTTVLGTSFNIKEQSNHNVQVTLVSGKVNVSDEKNPRAVLLKPNQQALVKPASGSIDTTSVDVSRFIEWKDNVISFDETPLTEAVAMLEDWYGVEIQIRNKDIKYCRITGRYENESLENVMESFQFVLKGRYTIEGKHVTLSGKGCRTTHGD